MIGIQDLVCPSWRCFLEGWWKRGGYKSFRAYDQRGCICTLGRIYVVYTCTYYVVLFYFIITMMDGLRSINA